MLDEPLMVVSLSLFGEPEDELETVEGSDINPDVLDSVAWCGVKLAQRLARTARIGKSLLAKGWLGSGGHYCLDFYKATSLKEAEAELRALGVGRDEITAKAYARA